MKYRSEFKHDFTNRDYLHCAAILKALNGSQEKNPRSQEICNFFSKYSKWDFKDFQNV